MTNKFSHFNCCFLIYFPNQVQIIVLRKSKKNPTNHALLTKLRLAAKTGIKMPKKALHPHTDKFILLLIFLVHSIFQLPIPLSINENNCTTQNPEYTSVFSGFTRVDYYSRFPNNSVANDTAPKKYKGAVSVRKMRGPSPAGITPFSVML